MTRTTLRRLTGALAMTATAAFAISTADPAAAAIDGSHDGSIFLAVAHDGGILHDATVSTDGHFAVDRFSVEGTGMEAVPDHDGSFGIWRFDLIGHEVPPGSVICGEGYQGSRSLGRACVTID